MAKKSLSAGQLIPTSSTPPSNAGFYRIDKNTIGVVGNMVQKNAQTNAESNIASGANLAAELAAINSPVTLLQSGMPFVRFAGDGGSTGLLFTGTAGNFTLSAAIVSGGSTIPHGYGYLPANAGGLGNAPGWFYFTMSSDTAGTFYNNQWVPVSGGKPVIPGSPTAFANPSGGRLTQTTDEVTCLTIDLPAGYFGANGLIRVQGSTISSSSGNLKNVRVYYNSDRIMQWYCTTSSVIEFEIWCQMLGSMQYQTRSRSGTSIGDGATAAAGNLQTVDMSGAGSLSITIHGASNTDTHCSILRQVNVCKG